MKIQLGECKWARRPVERVVIDHLVARTEKVLPENKALSECYNHGMETGDIHLFVKRWAAVEAIQVQELRDATPAENWRRLNAIWARAYQLGLLPPDNSDELEVIQRWAKLKNRVEKNAAV